VLSGGRIHGGCIQCVGEKELEYDCGGHMSSILNIDSHAQQNISNNNVGQQAAWLAMVYCWRI